MTPSTLFRLALGVGAGTLLLLVLSAGALGIVGEGGRVDRVYVTVPAVALVGAALARLRPGAMALVMGAAALTQAVVTATVLLADLHRTAGGNLPDLLLVNAMFVALLGVSGWLFRRAAAARSLRPAHP